MTERPNILLIVTDEERVRLPRPQGYCLPARERIASRGPPSSVTTPPPRSAARRGRSSTRASTCRSPRSTTTTTCRTSARSIPNWAPWAPC
ncbi:hypothetical protein ACFQZC_36070 [Streptacidiphilus monticola]